MNPYRLAAVLFLLFQAPAFAYTTHIHAPAVLMGLDKGVLTNMTLNVVPGNGTITVNGGSALVAADTIDSVHTAVAYATQYLNLSQSRYNFAFQIGSGNSNISGPSGGFVLTLLTLSGLEQKPLFDNFTATGTISPDGTIGPVDGIFDKVQAAKSINSQFVMVPYVSNSSSEYLIYYLSQQTYGTPVVEIKNISQAIPYAFGLKKPSYLNFSAATNYSPGLIPNESSVCPSCNQSAFAPLVNFTFNFTQSQIESINASMFASVRSQLLGQLQQYRQLSAKGYYYTGADLAFGEDPTAFMFANYNTSQADAWQVINNISSTCESLNYTPEMTSSNYEMVIGGRARLAWAMTTLNYAKSLLNASQTSDDVILAMNVAAPAQAWCAATGEMYNISSSMGGTPIALTGGVKSQAVAKLKQWENGPYAKQLYVQAANYSIANGDYATALYSLAYANIFYNSSARNYSKTAGMVSDALSSARGVWPVQFAIQSAFYQSEANLSAANSSQRSGYLSDAYSTAALSVSLGSLNGMLSSGFVAAPYANTNSSITAQINQISSQLTLITYTLGLVIVLMIIIFVVLIFILVNRPSGPGQNAAASEVDNGGYENAHKRKSHRRK